MNKSIPIILIFFSSLVSHPVNAQLRIVKSMLRSGRILKKSSNIKRIVSLSKVPKVRMSTSIHPHPIHHNNYKIIKKTYISYKPKLKVKNRCISCDKEEKDPLKFLEHAKDIKDLAPSQLKQRDSVQTRRTQ